MFMKWIEPTVEMRVREVTELCEKEADQFHQEFFRTIEELKTKIPGEAIDDLFRLENIFVEKMSVIETAYREGLKDGLKMRESINKILDV